MDFARRGWWATIAQGRDARGVALLVMRSAIGPLTNSSDWRVCPNPYSPQAAKKVSIHQAAIFLGADHSATVAETFDAMLICAAVLQVTTSVCCRSQFVGFCRAIFLACSQGTARQSQKQIGACRTWAPSHMPWVGPRHMRQGRQSRRYRITWLPGLGRYHQRQSHEFATLKASSSRWLVTVWTRFDGKPAAAAGTSFFDAGAAESKFVVGGKPGRP
jgi:hypothetical protein